MAKPETDKDLDPYSDEAIEIMVDYARGLRHRATAAQALYKISGLLPEYGEAFLTALRSSGPRSSANATMIRGYSKEPEAARIGKIGGPKDIRYR